MRDLQSLREEIDQLDEQLWEVIGKRADVVRQIGEWKRQHGEQVVQPERWQEVLQHCQSVADKHGLSETVIQEVMEAIHNESVRIES
jgi:chorismate mutase